MNIDDRIRNILIGNTRTPPMNLPPSTQAWTRLKFRRIHRREQAEFDWGVAAACVAATTLLCAFAATIGIPMLTYGVLASMLLTSTAVVVIGVAHFE